MTKWGWLRNQLERVRKFRSVPDPKLWSLDLHQHCYGELSYATVRGTDHMEDSSQVEIGHHATFVGVYDGHGGYYASRFIRDELFQYVAALYREHGGMSEDVIRTAFARTETAFLDHIRNRLATYPIIYESGSCVLVGIIWQGRLYVGNLGDSRAVMGSLDARNRIDDEQLTQDHNVNLEGVRQQLQALHPNDPNIVVCDNNCWRVKGIIQISRSIGDAYLKTQEFQVTDRFSRLHVSRPIKEPILSAEPDIIIRDIRPNDRFVIFASDGLWERMTNQEIVEMVHRHPREGIAKRLVNKAVEVAARANGSTANRVRKMAYRRDIHDDITVVVLFIDHRLLQHPLPVAELSILGNTKNFNASAFTYPRGNYGSGTSGASTSEHR